MNFTPSAGAAQTILASTIVSLLIFALPSSSQALPVGMSKAKQVATGYTNTCAIQQDDQVRCWGSGMAVPQDLGAVKKIAVGYALTITDPTDFACAIKQDDRVSCWSSYYPCPPDPELGYLACHINSEHPDSSSEALGAAKKISVGATVSCVVGLDDHVRCAGGEGEFNGQILREPAAIVPAAVGSTGTAQDVATGPSPVACAVKSNGGVLCWGDDSDGNNLLVVPTSLKAAGAAKRVFVGYSSICAIKQNNRVQCWGGGYGAVRPPADLGEVSELNLTGYLYCAKKTNSKVRCWGEGISSSFLPPMAIRNASDIMSISASAAGYGCAIRQGDNLSCWGSDHSGQISGRPVSAYRIVSSFRVFDTRSGCNGIIGYQPSAMNEYWRDLVRIPTAFGDAEIQCVYVRPWMSSGKLSVSRQAFAWGNNPTTISYQWQWAPVIGKGAKAKPGRWNNIPGATQSTYLTDGVGVKYLRACSSASNQDGQSGATCSMPRGPFN